jgi:hypothetical protein
MSPEQMRKKEAAQQESERHARYAQADGSMKSASSREYYVSPAIEAAAKENASIGGEGASINDNRY